MKKSFVLLISLLVLGSFVLCFAQASILKEKDQVQITENILYGDKSVVEGVSLELHNHYEDMLFWDTTYVIGKEPKVDTEYTMYQFPQDNFNHRWDGSIYFNDNNQHINWTEETLKSPEGLEVAYAELYESIGPSEEKEKTVFLKDYMDYYDFSVSFHSPREWGSEKEFFHFEIDEEHLEAELLYVEKTENHRYSDELIEKYRNQKIWIETFHEFFKIPVLENEVITINMRKNAAGEVSGYGMSSNGMGMATGDIGTPEYSQEGTYDSFQIGTMCSVRDGDVYFTFYTHTYNNEVVDTSLIPGGYGIYHFPYDEEEQEIYPEQLQVVYPLDPNLDVMDLTRDARGENLLLFTMENAEAYMSVIDIESMTLVEKFNLSEFRDDAWGIDYYVLEEDYMIVLTYGDVIVFSIDEDGNYKKQIEVSREPLNTIFLEDKYNYEVLQYDTSYDWNGEQLVFANNMYNVNGYMGTNFYVGMMDKNGLQYFAIYDTSLQSSASFDENGYETYTYAHCRPVNVDAIVVKWK